MRDGAGTVICPAVRPPSVVRPAGGGGETLQDAAERAAPRAAMATGEIPPRRPASRASRHLARKFSRLLPTFHMRAARSPPPARSALRHPPTDCTATLHLGCISV